MLRDRLGVDRAYWAEVDRAAGDWVVLGGAHAPGVPPVGGRFPLDAWQPQTSWLLDGRPNVVDDTQRDARLPDSVKEALAQLGVGADLGVPVQVDGRTRCELTVNVGHARRWSAEEIALVEGVAVRCWGEVERARAEGALRESEKRQAFLLKVSDALRPIADPVAIQETASRMTAEHLDIGRVAYCEIRYEPDIMVVVERDWPRRGMPSVAPGRYRMDDFGSFLAVELTAGRPAIVADATTDSRLSPAERENWGALEIVANCALPVLKEGRFVAYLVAQDDRRHDWTEREIVLLGE